MRSELERMRATDVEDRDGAMSQNQLRHLRPRNGEGEIDEGRFALPIKGLARQAYCCHLVQQGLL